MTKSALVVGIDDYSVQSQHDQARYGLTWPVLSCCAADADSMYHLLQHAFGFPAGNIILLKNDAASRRNILSALRYLLGNAAAGDVVGFTYSGHGGLLPATTAPDETRFHEAIIPYEGDWIPDVRLDQLAAGLPAEAVNFTAVLDSCHSGGMHPGDQPEQAVPRSVPFRPEVAQVVEHLKTWWPFGICLPDGSDALIPNVENVKLVDGVLSLDETPGKDQLAGARAVLIAASQYWETAGESAGLGHGFLTQAFLDVVNSSDFMITHQDLIDQLTPRVKVLSGDTQTPRLRGLPGRLTQQFLQPWGSNE
jgi:hypothetical protein